MDTKKIGPMPTAKTMLDLFGIGPIPKPKWMPNLWHRRLKQKQQLHALSQWKLCPPPELTDEQMRMQIAQELRDWAERLIGYSHVDPEKSSIPRNKFRVNSTDLYVKYLKYDPPPTSKPLSKRGHRRMLRKVIRDTDKKLAAMDIKVEM